MVPIYIVLFLLMYVTVQLRAVTLYNVFMKITDFVRIYFAV